MTNFIQDLIIRYRFRKAAKQRRKSYKNVYDSLHRNEHYF
jgi:hypothetical protein